MADQRQAEGQLPQPCLGNRQVEEHLRVVGLCRREGGVESLFRLDRLLIDELAADRVLTGQTADRLGACQGLQGQLPPLEWHHRLGGMGKRARSIGVVR